MSQTHKPVITSRRWRNAEQTIARLKKRIAIMESSKREARAERKLAMVTFKVEQGIKNSAQTIAAASGLSLTDVLNVSLRRFIDQESIETFPIFHMSPTLKADLAEIEDDRKHGRNRGVVLSSADDIDDFFLKLRKPRHARRAASKVQQSAR